MNHGGLQPAEVARGALGRRHPAAQEAGASTAFFFFRLA